MSSAVWPALAELAKQPLNLRQEFAADPDRATRYALNACGIELDYSKNLINESIWQHLLRLAEQSDLTNKRAQMFAGDKINSSEQRSVWHTALRAPLSANLTLEGADISAEISACHAQMFALVEQLNSHGLTPQPSTRDEFAKYMAKETATWGRIIRERKISAQ